MLLPPTTPAIVSVANLEKRRVRKCRIRTYLPITILSIQGALLISADTRLGLRAQCRRIWRIRALNYVNDGGDKVVNLPTYKSSGK